MPSAEHAECLSSLALALWVRSAQQCCHFTATLQVMFAAAHQGEDDSGTLQAVSVLDTALHLRSGCDGEGVHLPHSAQLLFGPPDEAPCLALFSVFLKIRTCRAAAMEKAYISRTQPSCILAPLAAPCFFSYLFKISQKLHLQSSCIGKGVHLPHPAPALLSEPNDSLPLAFL